MPRKKRALLMTVGTGTGDKRCSLAHGLMCSIDSKDPDFICFFVSKDSKPTVDALKKVFNSYYGTFIIFNRCIIMLSQIVINRKTFDISNNW